MTELKNPSVPLFATAFQLCKEAKLESGKLEINVKDSGVGVRVPGGLTPPPGSFAVFIDDEDEDHVCWEEWTDGIAIFEPLRESPKIGEVYLTGHWDPYHRWLDHAAVQRIGAIVEGKVIFREQGELAFDSVVDLTGDTLFVARLMAVRPRKF